VPALPSAKALASKTAKVALAAVASLLVAVGGAWWAIEGDGNVHVLVPGVAIRSAEPSGARLVEMKRRFGLRSVVNLRGRNDGQPWYDEEVRASRLLGLQHFDVALSAQHELSPAQVDEVLAMIERAPKPVLIHCNGGSDRTGLVSAAWLYAHGSPKDVAEAQLALRYGHFPWLGSKTSAMDRSLEAFEARQARPMIVPAPGETQG
jgi:protein tyrosine/serine phosphatase